MRVCNILCVLVFHFSMFAYSGQHVAVLETVGDKQTGLSSTELAYLTDELRTQAIDALPVSAGFGVMTRENIRAMLPPGKSIEECEGDCMVTTGRNISADFVAQGRVGKVGKRLALTVELYDTRSGNLLGSFNELSPEVDGLIELVRKKAPMLFSKARGDQVPDVDYGAPVPVDAAPDEVGTVVTVEFTDGAGAVMVDGKLACGNKAKCSQELANGQHKIVVSRDGYRDTTFNITVPNGSNRYTLSLTSKAGVLTIRASDADGGDAVAAEVVVDGRVVGTTPWSGLVPVTARQIVVRAEGYGEAEVTERPDEGQKQAVYVKLKSNRPNKDYADAEVRERLDEGKRKTANGELMGYKPKVSQGMVSIPAGCFDMGSGDGFSDEKPVHRVCLGAFNMDQTEVTQGQYQSVMGKNPSKFVSCGDNCPVENVDWNDANLYCQKVGKRLPTEAEWEYAARAGTSTQWYCGNSESCLDRIAWYSANSNNQTHPVGLKAANAWVLYDMTGNVREWTSDWYGSDYYGNSASRDPKGPASGWDRVNRGDSWGGGPAGLRSTYRGRNKPGDRDPFVGFRCASPER